MDVFDIIGPIMIGPSSSHTAGAVRIGRIAGILLKDKPVYAQVLLHGSFAETYKGHGTDKAIVAGIMGMNPNDVRIRDSLNLAKEQNIEVVFEKVQMEGVHPNTAYITLKDAQNHTVTVCGSSIGGGNIVISEINGMEVEITGQQTTLLITHEDVPGVIAHVTNFIAGQGANIGNFKLSRNHKGELALMTIEVDGTLPDNISEGINHLPHVIYCTILQPI